MQALVLGLGRMGLPLCERMRERGLSPVGFDLDASRRALAVSRGIAVAEADDPARAAGALPGPRNILLLTPAGPAVDRALASVASALSPGDRVFDFGNSNYEDSRRRRAELSARGLIFYDVGMSGGVSGARSGPCLTVGCEAAEFRAAEAFFAAIACEGGYCHAGPPGWGHLVKAVHNGIEYAVLQAIGEGLHTIHSLAALEGADVDLPKLVDVWNHGSIIESRLLRDARAALDLLQHTEISGRIGGGETGRWARALADRAGAAAPALDAALAAREASQTKPTYAGQVIAAIRNVFGQHDMGGQG